MPTGGLGRLADAFGRNPEGNDEDYIRRSLVPFAIAGAQLGQYRRAGRQAVNQQSRAYRQDVRGSQQGYARRRNQINPMIGNQLLSNLGMMGAQNTYGQNDLQAQGFSGGTAGLQSAMSNQQNQAQGLANRQRSYMADTRVADRAQSRDTRNTGRILQQSGRTAVQQAYVDAMSQLMIARIQQQIQLQNMADQGFLRGY